jgi:hypothetical protein
MGTPGRRFAVGVLVLVLGAVVGALIDRYALPARQAGPPSPQPGAPPAPKPDFTELVKKWSYPGATNKGSGETGAIRYHQIATTPDDLPAVAAYYRPLVGEDIPVEGNSGGGVGKTDSYVVTQAESWSAGVLARSQRLVLAARVEAGYSATLVLYREEGLTHIVLTLFDR